MKNEIIAEAIKSAPAVAITGAITLFGMTLNEWVALATLLWVLLQFANLAIRMVRKYLLGKDE